MKKVLFPILLYYPSQLGGPANSIYWIVKHLNSTNFIKAEVISTCTGINDQVCAELNKSNKNYATYVKTSHSKFSVQFLLKNMQTIAKVNILHFSSIFFPPTLCLVLWGLLLHKKIVISPRGELYDSALKRKSIFKSLYLNFFKIFKNNIVWHATNNVEEQQIKKVFKTKRTFVLPNYIEKSERLRTEKKKQFLFLGRINPIKGIDIFIEALCNNPLFIEGGFRFIIAGKAKLEYEKKYEQLLYALIKKKGIERKVRFVGEVHKLEKEQLLSESYCLVLPSKSENFGNVVLESLNQGTPVIASKGTPWELLNINKCGWWVSSDSDTISRTISKVIEMNNEEYLQYSNNAFKLIDEKFDIEKNVKNWVKIYSNL